MLGQMLGMANVPFLYYYGNMTSKQHEKALEQFDSNPDKKILVRRRPTVNSRPRQG